MKNDFGRIEIYLFFTLQGSSGWLATSEIFQEEHNVSKMQQY